MEGTPRTVLFVPQILKEALVKEAHGQLLTGHDGISKTKERLRVLFLAKYGCRYRRTYQIMPKMPKEKR
jgi:hypothetical protein